MKPATRTNAMRAALINMASAAEMYSRAVLFTRPLQAAFRALAVEFRERAEGRKGRAVKGETP